MYDLMICSLIKSFLAIIKQVSESFKCINYHLCFTFFETRRRPRSCRGSRQLRYYVSHELSASLKIQHKDLRNKFLCTLCTSGCHVRHLYLIISELLGFCDFRLSILWTIYDFRLFILWTIYDFRLSILWTTYDFRLSILWAIYGSILDHKSLWFQTDHTLDHI